MLENLTQREIYMIAKWEGIEKEYEKLVNQYKAVVEQNRSLQKDLNTRRTINKKLVKLINSFLMNRCELSQNKLLAFTWELSEVYNEKQT